MSPDTEVLVYHYGAPSSSVGNDIGLIECSKLGNYLSLSNYCCSRP